MNPESVKQLLDFLNRKRNPKEIVQDIAGYAFVGILYTLVQKCARMRDRSEIDSETFNVSNDAIKLINGWLDAPNATAIQLRFFDTALKPREQLTVPENSVLAAIHVICEREYLDDALQTGRVPKEWLP